MPAKFGVQGGCFLGRFGLYFIKIDFSATYRVLTGNDPKIEKKSIFWQKPGGYPGKPRFKRHIPI